MPSISHVHRIAAVIRQEMSARIGELRAQTPLPAGPQSLGRRSGPQPKRGPLATLIRKRIGSIDPNDSDRGRKAFRIFLESVLLGEFGNELMNDPAFYELVDTVQRHIEEQPELAPLVRQAVAQLLGLERSGS